MRLGPYYPSRTHSSPSVAVPAVVTAFTSRRHSYLRLRSALNLASPDASRVKQLLEQRAAERRAQSDAAAQRRLAHEAALAAAPSSAEALRQSFDAAERVIARAGHYRTSPSDFTVLRVIGRGAFGEVACVRRNVDGEILALKRMSKQRMLEKHQVRESVGWGGGAGRAGCALAVVCLHLLM